MFLSEWREFPPAPCLAVWKTWWQLESRRCWNRARSLTCFTLFFLPGRAKDLSTPRCICVCVCIYIYIYREREIKQSHYRPGEALRIPGDSGSQITRQSAHEGGKVVSLTHRPLLPSGVTSGTHFC